MQNKYIKNTYEFHIDHPGSLMDTHIYFLPDISHRLYTLGNTLKIALRMWMIYHIPCNLKKMINKWAIPWWRLWPKFENFSLLIDHSSYNKQAINHFVVDVRSTLGGQSTATPQKINLGQGQAQCPLGWFMKNQIFSFWPLHPSFCLLEW